jgi:hypothetical protein
LKDKGMPRRGKLAFSCDGNRLRVLTKFFSVPGEIEVYKAPVGSSIRKYQIFDIFGRIGQVLS